MVDIADKVDMDMVVLVYMDMMDIVNMEMVDVVGMVDMDMISSQTFLALLVYSRSWKILSSLYFKSFLDALASLKPILFTEWVRPFFWIADNLRIHQ